MMKATLVQGGSVAQTIEISRGTTLFDACSECDINFEKFDFYIGEKRLTPFLSLNYQGVNDGDLISVIEKPNSQKKSDSINIPENTQLSLIDASDSHQNALAASKSRNSEGSISNSVQEKIEQIIVEALKIEDRKFDRLDVSSECNLVYNSIVADLNSNQTPYDDLEYTDVEPSQSTEMPKDPLPPMWGLNEEAEDRDYQDQIRYEFDKNAFRSIEDAGERLTRIFSHGWKW